MFEHYVATYPSASREVCDNVDLIFMNQAEYDGLYGDAQLPVPKAPLIVKRGSAGARLLVDGHPQEVEAHETKVVDPTGGGEILASVFLALRAEGQPERAALEYAVRAATSCVADYGVTGRHLAAELEAIRREVTGWPRPYPPVLLPGGTPFGGGGGGGLRGAHARAGAARTSSPSAASWCAGRGAAGCRAAGGGHRRADRARPARPAGAGTV